MNSWNRTILKHWVSAFFFFFGNGTGSLFWKLNKIPLFGKRLLITFKKTYKKTLFYGQWICVFEKLTYILPPDGSVICSFFAPIGPPRRFSLHEIPDYLKQIRKFHVFSSKKFENWNQYEENTSVSNFT